MRRDLFSSNGSSNWGRIVQGVFFRWYFWNTLSILKISSFCKVVMTNQTGQFDNLFQKIKIFIANVRNVRHLLGYIFWISPWNCQQHEEEYLWESGRQMSWQLPLTQEWFSAFSETNPFSFRKLVTIQIRWLSENMITCKILSKLWMNLWISLLIYFGFSN